MSYADDVRITISELIEPRLKGLEGAQFRALIESERTSSEDAVEHLKHGAGRRLGILQHAFRRVFELFPEDTRRPLDREALNDVQVNLHAFFINLVGLFDNLAWAYAHHHGLTRFLEKPLSIDLFKKQFQAELPRALSEFLTEPRLAQWQVGYLKNYRDALAHRIPLYVPPCVVFTSDRSEYNRLELQRNRLESELRFDEAFSTREAQRKLEHPCFTFTHSFRATPSPGHLYVHPQLLADALTASSVAGVYFDAWRAR